MADKEHGPRAVTVSVIMGAYNSASTLAPAIESILNQTCSDWQLVVCDDGSTDDTLALARSYAGRDPRIVVLSNQANVGLAPTLNRCAGVATGRFLARMDADDVCAPTRLSDQVAYLDAHDHLALVGSAVYFFDETGLWGGIVHRPEPQPSDFLRGNPFAHGSVLMRRDALTQVGGYPEGDDHWRVEDYRLWVEMYARGLRGSNLSTPLYGLRNDREATIRRSPRARRNEAGVILDAVRMLDLPWVTRVWAARPIALGMLPAPVYEHLYRRWHALRRWRARGRAGPDGRNGTWAPAPGSSDPPQR